MNRKVLQPGSVDIQFSMRKYQQHFDIAGGRWNILFKYTVVRQVAGRRHGKMAFVKSVALCKGRSAQATPQQRVDNGRTLREGVGNPVSFGIDPVAFALERVRRETNSAWICSGDTRTSILFHVSQEQLTAALKNLLPVVLVPV